MRTAFLIILCLHGIIHLLGFFKGFELARIEQLTQPVSKSAAILWLLATLLFVVTALLYLFHNSYWWVPGVVALILSQYLIITAWQDARFGTIPNGIILLVCFLGFMSWQFSQTANQRITALIANLENQPDLTTSYHNQLPTIVETWLARTGIQQQPAPQTIFFQQAGKMRTSKDGPWMPFTSEQHFTLSSPGFVWKAAVNPNGLMQLSGLDELINGEGRMRIKLLNTIPVVDEEGPAIDQGSMVRYLAEIIWFPWAARSNYLTWESIDDRSASVTFNWNNTQVSAQYYFNEEGDPTSIRAMRYYSTGSDTAVLRPWIIDIPADSYEVFSGIRIPSKGMTITWELPDGAFTWFEMEIVSADY